MASESGNIKESVQLPSMNIELDTQGIVYVTYVEGSIIDIEEKKEERETILKITKGIKHPVLFSFENMVTITRAAKEYSVTSEAEDSFLAVALMAESFAHVIASNFYIKFYNPKIASKVFRNDIKAVEWLLEVKNNKEEKKSDSSKSTFLSL